VSSKTREAMLLCEAAGFDVILVETVGVGQSETAVNGMVDFFLLLMLAGAGDELQGIKKGIMEMADALFINKADGDNVQAAKSAKVSYQNALHLFPLGENNWSPQVLTGSSVSKEGLEQCWKLVEDFEGKMKVSGFWEKNRSEQRLSWLNESIQSELGKAFYKDSKVQERLKSEEGKVLSGELSPMKLARELTELFFKL